jgi:hypothetical protein
MMSLIWARKDTEGAEAFAAFEEYMNLGSERSLSEVARRCNKSRSLIARWSQRWDWVERARAWDDYVQGTVFESKDEVIRRVAEEEAEAWVARMRAQREQEYQMSQRLIAKAQEMLDSSLDTSRWSMRDASAFLDAAARLVRQAAGEMGVDGPLEDEEQVERGAPFVSKVVVSYESADAA